MAQNAPDPLLDSPFPLSPERYVIVRSLGKGAQGTVDLVHDTLHDRSVARKILNDTLDDNWVDLFRREFQILADLYHERLVRVYDFGRLPDGRPFFTREYAEGQDLLSVTEGMDARLFLLLCIEVCRALRPLHRAGLLHGDIKPTNIIVSKSSGVGESRFRVTPIDFSFAVHATGIAPKRGTLPYMAPEILCGHGVDQRSDLYSLGITIFETLSGSLPFSGDASDIVESHLHRERVAPVSFRIVTSSETDRDLLGHIGNIAIRLMDPVPDHRFPDLDELESALTCLSSLPIPAENDSRIPGRSLLNGREDLIDDITGNLRRRLDGVGEEPLLVLEGAVGTGTEAVSRAVKWRMQLLGCQEATLSFRRGAMSLEPFLHLLTRLCGLAPELISECRQLCAEFRSRQLSVDRLASRTSSLMLQIVSQRPLLLRMEGLDEASPEAFALIRALLATVSPRHPLCILGTVRPGSAWQDRLGAARVFHLGPLDENQIAALIEQYLGAAGLSDRDAILRHTGGNPRFVIQLLEEAIRTGQPAGSLVAQAVPVDLKGQWLRNWSALPSTTQQILAAAAVLEVPSTATDIAVVAAVDEPLTAALDRLCAEELLRQDLSRFSVSTSSLMEWVLTQLPQPKLRRLSARAFDVTTESSRRLIHAARCGKNDFVRQFACGTVDRLMSGSSPGAAGQILETIIAHEADSGFLPEYQLRLGAVRIQMGLIDTAQSLLNPLSAAADPGVQSRALCLLSRIAVRRGQLDAAAASLNFALQLTVHPTEQATERAALLGDLAEIEYRRCAYATSIELCDTGLTVASLTESARISLLCAKAKACTALSRHSEALRLTADAIEMATRQGDRPALAFAMDTNAWILSHAGRMEDATESLETAATLYRETDNLPRLARALQVIGDNCYWMERWSLMLVRHEEAVRLSAAMDDPLQRNEILLSSVVSLICVGRFEAAALLLQRVTRDVFRRGTRAQQVKVLVYEGDLAARQGRYAEALSRWQAGYEGFTAIRENAVCAEMALEIANVRITRGDSGDLEAASDWIEVAVACLREDLGRNFDALLELTRCRLQLCREPLESTLPRIERLVEELEQQNHRDLLWQAHAAVGFALVKAGLPVIARVRLRRALSLLEELARDLPTEHRHAFFQDIRRDAVRKQIARLSATSSRDVAVSADATAHSTGEVAALYRILEFNRRIATEIDSDALMTTILDAAIDISGADRGFILSPSAQGLEVRVVRGMSSEPHKDAHFRFSRSIAESVFVDQEPIVTVDAVTDHRFNTFLSIHHLQLRSVACVPISWRSKILGVLYLENRLLPDCFGQSHIRVLSAFADQVAITLSQASLLDETRRMNDELQKAKADLEALVTCQQSDLASTSEQLAMADRQMERLHRQVTGEGEYFGLIGSGHQMRQVFSTVDRIRDINVPVVIIGTSGTGKDALAKVIHEAGNRAREPFVPVACGAIPDTLVESLLFGYEQGAFSGALKRTPGLFETAGSGTLYLDNIEEMSPKMQIALLRVQQEGAYQPLGGRRRVAVDCRWICSGALPLAELVSAGRLREDLYFRLQVVSMTLPPLKDRLEDVPVLFRKFLDRETARMGIARPRIHPEVFRVLSTLSFPGNVRELEHLVRRVLVLHSDCGHMSPEMLTDATGNRPASGASLSHRDASRGRHPGEGEILTALEQCQWNRSEAARRLGIPRRTFYRRLNELGLMNRRDT